MIELKHLRLTLGVLSFALGALSAPTAGAQQSKPSPSTNPFKGVIKLDVRDSVPDWGPYTPKKAPKGAPNILFVLYDDTGLAAWSSYGGRINMPTLDKLASRGLMYSQWHTCALCSPTRSCILTGRNHHLNGMAAITEAANGFPGQHGRIPDQCATIGQILQDNCWSTFWLGKNHNVPEQDIASGASRKQWPLQKGFDRFYGFLGGETNQWYPDLVEDNRFIEAPYNPEEGYHLSKDLADKAIGMIRDQKASNPSKPWFMWYCPGANHAPHHCPQEYIDKYKGKFDDGYDAYRKWVLPRMIAKGVIPEGTELTPFNPLPANVSNPADFVRPWESLKADEKKLFSRLAEVYAGFSEYTDVQIGRIIDYLEKSGQLDNTIVFYAADNGASGEGTPNGSVNENKFFNGYPDDLAENMKYLEVLGGPDTYEHYPTGWAAAFSAPFKMFKRYSEYAGGTCDPLVISWPKGIKARGEVRNQYHHAVDIVPTILEICGLEMPKVYKGVRQYPLSGVSMRYTFDAAPDAPTQKKRQYYAMLGTRAIWEDGWKAVALHAPSQARAISTRTSGNSTMWTWTLPSRKTWPRSTPRSSRRSSRHGSRRRRRTSCCRWMIAQPWKSLALSVRLKKLPASDTFTIPAPLRSRKASLSTSEGVRTRSSPTWRSPIRTAPASFSPKVPDSAAIRCSSRTRDSTTSTTSLASSRNSGSSRANSNPASTRWGWSSSERRLANTRSLWAKPGSMSTTRWWPRAR